MVLRASGSLTTGMEILYFSHWCGVVQGYKILAWEQLAGGLGRSRCALVLAGWAADQTPTEFSSPGWRRRRRLVRKKRLLGRGARWDESRETGKSTISSAVGPPREGQRDGGVTLESWHSARQA